MHGRPYAFTVLLAAATGATAVVVALLVGLPLRDPDGVAGPSYVRLPLILGIFFLADVLPRVVRRVRSPRQVWPALRSVTTERWPWSRLKIVLLGLGSFYVTYVGYRNLKSYLPFVREDRVDDWLSIADSILFLGQDPAVVLHTVLGTGLAAHVLSFVYISYLLLVPVSLAAALLWNRNIALGFWYVTALNLNWVVGAASYYLLPALGPVYSETESHNFDELPETGVSLLQQSLWGSRLTVLFDPWATSSVHGVAAFASLHVSVVFTAAYFAYKVKLHKSLRIVLWTYLGLTILATIYFGWHYVIDDIAGIGIGWLAVTLGARVTGHDRYGRHRSTVTDSSEDADGAGSAGDPADAPPLPQQNRVSELDSGARSHR